VILIPLERITSYLHVGSRQQAKNQSLQSVPRAKAKEPEATAILIVIGVAVPLLGDSDDKTKAEISHCY